MQYFTFTRQRLTGLAAFGMVCGAALMPVASLAGTAAAATGTGTFAAGVGAAGVPASFQPVSASFQSSARGFALGALGCRQVRACRARLVATADAGAHWSFVNAPDVRLFNPAGNSLLQASRVNGVVFADRRNGWLYGPGLWATHDGGRHWRRISLGGDVVPSLGGGVAAMRASAGTAYAVVAPDPFHGKPAELYASPAGQNAWARVGTMTGGPSWGNLAVSGQAAWFGTSSRLWATTDGAHWQHYPAPCPASDIGGLGSIAAASPSRVTFLCLGDGAAGSMGKDVFRSTDGGKTTHLAGRAPFGGSGGMLAVPPHRNKVITLASSSGASFLYRSADGGKTWTTATYPTGGVPWRSLSYVTRDVGYVVLDGGLLRNEGINRLLRTSNAGRTWHTVRF
jgi:photosystem II stability/assembly factor-like uncharacterized protein